MPSGKGAWERFWTSVPRAAKPARAPRAYMRPQCSRSTAPPPSVARCRRRRSSRYVVGTVGDLGGAPLRKESITHSVQLRGSEGCRVEGDAQAEVVAFVHLEPADAEVVLVAW